MGKGYNYRGGSDFIHALLRTAGLPELKIIFGTRDRKWYVIDKEDRDYYTTWALTYREAKTLGKDEAEIVSTRGRVL
jgi:hypothetical protein